MTSAVTIKLSRVVLLAPLVVAVSLWSRRDPAKDPAHRDGVACDSAGEPRTAGDSTDGVATAGAPARRLVAAVPLFVVGFLASAALRSTNVLPGGVLSAARGVETLLFGAAMLALGTGVRLSRLRRLGLRPLVLGLLSWVLVAGVGLLGIHVVEFD